MNETDKNACLCGAYLPVGQQAKNISTTVKNPVLEGYTDYRKERKARQMRWGVQWREVRIANKVARVRFHGKVTLCPMPEGGEQGPDECWGGDWWSEGEAGEGGSLCGQYEVKPGCVLCVWRAAGVS